MSKSSLLQAPLWHLLNALLIHKWALCCLLHLLFLAAVLVLIVNLSLLLRKLLPLLIIRVNPAAVTILIMVLTLRLTAGHDTHNDFDSDHNIGGYNAKILSASVHIGPPSRAKWIQPAESVTATADTSDLGILDVKMHSPPHGLSSQWGCAHTIKAIGSSSGSQLARSSGASKPYGATIHGRALGNAPNIGDFNAVDEDTTINIEGTVNLFPSNTWPTTVDVDETAVNAVTIPFEGALAPLLQHIIKYYSPMSGKHFKYYFSLS